MNPQDKQREELIDKIMWLLYPEKGDVAFRIMHKPLGEEILKTIDLYTQSRVLEARLDELLGLSVGVDDQCADEWRERIAQLNQERKL